MRLTNNIGILLLAIYLLIVGLTQLFPALHIPAIVTAILAIVAGILLLIGR